MIQVSELSKSFGQHLVLENLSFDLEMGQFITIIGRNGSGKSTLLKVLAKQSHFDRGQVFYNQKSITQVDSPLGVEFAYLTINSLLSQFEESLHDLKEVVRVEVPKFNEDIFARLVKMFSLNTDEPLAAFSTGQRVKALFALKAAQQPKVYILDEVTAVLDPGSRFLLMNFLKSEVQAGALVLLCTNIASETEEVSDYLMVLGERKLQLFAKKAELANQFEKVRMKSSVTAQLRNLIESAQGQIIDFNADASVSVLFPTSAQKPVEIEWVKDQRAVTISDISKYFSVG